MRRHFLTLAMALTALAASAQQKAPVYITAGQSNADGRAYISEGLPDYMKGGYNYFHYANVTSEAKTSFTSRVFDGSQESGRFAFSDVTNYWIDQAMQSDFYGIKCAYGGTAIDINQGAAHYPTWNASADYLSTAQPLEGTEVAKRSLAMSLSRGFKSLADNVLSQLSQGYDVKAITWHQGESDRQAAGNYEQNLTELINYLRKEIYNVTGDEADLKLPFIMGTVSENSSQYNSKITQAQKAVASSLENVYVIDLSDAQLRSDNLHFTAEWTEYFGKLVYNKMVEIGAVDGEKIETVKPKTADDVDYGEVAAEREWNFAKENWSEETTAALAANINDVHSSYGYRYGALSNTQLTAGDYEIPETKGLYFTASRARVAVNPTKGAVCFIGDVAKVKVPQVKPGQFIYVKAETGKSGTARGIVATDASREILDVIQGDTISGSGVVESIYWVQDTYTNPVDAEFTVSGGVSWLYEIKVLDVNPLSPVVSAVNIALDGEYQTYTPSYNLDFTDNEAVEAYAGKLNSEGTAVVLTKVSKVKKGEGLILKRINDAEKAKVSVVADAEAIADNMLQGVTADITASEMMAKGTAYVLGADNLFHQLVEGADGIVAGGKAYLLVPAGVEKKQAALRVVFGNQATGIGSVEDNDSAVASGIYTITGVKVADMSAPGIYVVNGKKYIVK